MKTDFRTWSHESLARFAEETNAALKKVQWHLATDGVAAVDRNVFWQPMKDCPRGTKVQLLGDGVATYGVFTGDPFWRGWCPLPSKPEWMK